MQQRSFRTLFSEQIIVDLSVNSPQKISTFIYSINAKGSKHPIHVLFNKTFYSLTVFVSHVGGKPSSLSLKSKLLAPHALLASSYSPQSLNKFAKIARSLLDALIMKILLMKDGKMVGSEKVE